MPSRIEDYALIGDCQTAALVGRDGSIDWLCFPRFDSGACFAALLGTPEHGRWLLAPAGEVRQVRRRYRDGTLVLETEFETDDGAVALIDFMPPRGEAPDLVRIVEGRRGRVADADGAGHPVRLRLDRPLGPPGRAGDLGDRRARHAPPPDRRRAAGRGPQDGGRVHRRGGAAGPVRPDVAPVASPRPAGSSTPRRPSARPSSWWRDWSGRCTDRGRVARGGRALADHAQGADLRPDRRHRRGADHLAARAASAACATGTTATAGSATRRSPCTRCSTPATTTRPAPGASGCSAPWPAARRRCTSCTAWPASGG